MKNLKLTDKRKKLLGVFSFVCPGVMILGIIIICIISVVMAVSGSPSEAALVFTMIFSGLLIMASFGSLALQICYFIFEIMDDKEQTNQKVLWIVLLLLVQWLAVPFYWYFRIHKREF